LNIKSLTETELEKSSFVSPVKNFLLSNFHQDEIDNLISKMKKSGEIDDYKNRIFSTNTLQPLIDKIKNFIAGELEEKPHLDGLSVDIIAAGVGQPVNSIDEIVELMCDKKILKKKKNRFDVPERSIEVKGEIKKIAGEIEQELYDSKYMPSTISYLLGNDKTKKEAFEYLVNSGKAIKTGRTLAFHIDRWNEILSAIKKIFNSGENLTVSLLREKLNNSRKYVIPILEETDRQRITIRQGDIRIKGENIEEE
jgi:hypothetical protein